MNAVSAYGGPMDMQPTPDTKDWTWVLIEPCPDCGFDCRSPQREELSSLCRDVGRRWAAVLAATEQPAVRPEPTVWSPLEYACHVRDVFALATYRHSLMLSEADPFFENWDQDATAIREGYARQDPDQVAEQVVQEAARYADALADVMSDDWDRTGRRGDGASFTVETFARYLIHDPIHHLTDVTGERWP